MGILTFKANKEGLFDFTLGKPVGGGDEFQELDEPVSYGSSQITVSELSAVPLPGAVWFFVSGFAGLRLLSGHRKLS